MAAPSLTSFNPAFAGINPFTTKYSTDFANKYFQPTTPTAPGTLPAVPAVDWTGISQGTKDQIALQKALLPDYLDLAKATSQFNTDATLKQMQGLYPYLSAASAQATARNLAASEKFAAFKESLPTSQQAIMASKQGQMSSAADAEYRRALGTAAQQQAATDFARKYAGQTFSQA